MKKGELMARFKEADARIFANIWICMRCNSKNKGTTGKKPTKCRKCNSKGLRLKKKALKKTG